jgi:hypothetical protein
LARQIGRRQGNRHLSAVLTAAATPARPFVSPSSPGGIIQRQPLTGIVGRNLATIRITNESRTAAEGQVTVETELVSGDQQPGQFDGYGRRIQAQSRAAAEPNLCAVVEDRQGKFHALRTGWPGRTPDVQAEIELAEHDFRHVWWVNLPGRRGTLPETGSLSWAERVTRALAWKIDMVNRRVPEDFETYCRHRPSHAGSDAGPADVRSCLEVEFVDLLAVALDIDRSEIHVIASGGSASPDALVNFNIDLTDRGQGGIHELPHDRETPVRRPSITVGPAAFESESELSVISTAIHESEHVRQALDATELLAQWRRSGGRQDFPDWLRRQLTRRRNPITQEQHDLAMELWNSSHRSGEVLSYIEGFIRTYGNRPITTTSYRFDSLNSGARFWSSSGSRRIKEMGIQRLATFYPTLDRAHQADLARHARDMARSTAETHRPFWQALVAQVL